MLHDVAPCTSTTTEFMCVSEECCFACVRRRLRALMPVHPEENDHTPSAIHLDSHASREPCASQVPRVYGEFSKARVLTMSFEEGCNVTDVAAILGMGLKVQDVARRLTEAFNKQIFEAGFGIVCFQHLLLLNFSCIVDVKTQCTSCNIWAVHCDPHPANVLVRPSSAWFGFRNRPQLVLLDHGLYRSLDAEFTREYCSLWRVCMC